MICLRFVLTTFLYMTSKRAKFFSVLNKIFHFVYKQKVYKYFFRFFRLIKKLKFNKKYYFSFVFNFFYTNRIFQIFY